MLPTLFVLAVTGAAIPVPWFRGLAVTPAAEPRPASRYELLPPAPDRRPGNAAPSFYRALLSLPKTPASGSDAWLADSQRRQAWAALPLYDLPAEEIKTYLKPYNAALRELDRAAAAERCEWDLLPRVRAEGVDLQFPEIGPARDLAEVLWLRTRVELGEGRFDAAAGSLRTGYQTARNVAVLPGLLPLVCGLAQQTWFTLGVEEWVARPGSPNLYSALSALPRPALDPRPAFAGDAALFDNLLPSLAGRKTFPASGAEAAKVLDGVMADLRRVTAFRDTPFPKDWWDLFRSPEDVWPILSQVPTSPKELLALGRAEAELDRLDPVRVVVWAAAERSLARRAELAKWVGAEYRVAAPHLAVLRGRVDAELDRAVRPHLMASALSIGAWERTLYSVARADRRVQLLRVVEAVRLHAAGHGGMPPARLADIAVPVPDDPLTGTPFGYRVKPGAVVLTAPPADGRPPTVENAMAYELRFRAVD